MRVTSKVLSCIVVSLIFISTLVAPAKASTSDGTPIVLADCKSELTVPCIESIQIKTADGALLPTVLTGRSAGVDRDFTGRGYEEYSVAGLSFEGTSKNLFIPRIVYYPYSTTEHCSDAGLCHRERDYLALGVQPSWLNRGDLNPLENELKLPNRPTNLLCGSKENRTKCYRSNNFENDIDFIFVIRMPSAFTPIWASGSAQDIKVNNLEDGVGQSSDFNRLMASIGTLGREMVLFSDYYENPIQAIESSPFADFPADWPGIWIHGSRDQSVNPLGNCRGIPFISVSTNGIYQEVPLWNEQSQTVDLKLYAPHRRVDGQLNRGFYELHVSSELAKCFWKIDASNQTRARVVITYPDSDQDLIIETTSVSFEAGILRVVATNFTFSSPTIKTRLVAENKGIDDESKSSDEVTSLPQKTIIKKRINCIKGSQVKVVSAKKACPKGFKRQKK